MKTALLLVPLVASLAALPQQQIAPRAVSTNQPRYLQVIQTAMAELAKTDHVNLAAFGKPAPESFYPKEMLTDLNVDAVWAVDIDGLPIKGIAVGRSGSFDRFVGSEFRWNSDWTSPGGKNVAVERLWRATMPVKPQVVAYCPLRPNSRDPRQPAILHLVKMSGQTNEGLEMTIYAIGLTSPLLSLANGTTPRFNPAFEVASALPITFVAGKDTTRIVRLLDRTCPNDVLHESGFYGWINVPAQ